MIINKLQISVLSFSFFFLSVSSFAQINFSPSPVWQASPGSFPTGLGWADVDGDGDLDLGAGSWSSSTGVFENINGKLTTSFAKTRSTGQGTQQIAWGDFDEDGLIPLVKEFQGNGKRKLFYPGQQPLHAISTIKVNEKTLNPDQYCYDLVAGWISLATPPANGEILEISYIISKDLDLAVTNWETVKVYANTSIATAIHDEINPITGGASIKVFPNPLSSVANMEYSIRKKGKVIITVSDGAGKEVATLADEEKTEGSYSLKFQAGNLPVGVYFVRIASNGFNNNLKILILR